MLHHSEGESGARPGGQRSAAQGLGQVAIQHLFQVRSFHGRHGGEIGQRRRRLGAALCKGYGPGHPGDHVQRGYGEGQRGRHSRYLRQEQSAPEHRQRRQHHHFPAIGKRRVPT